MMKKLLIIFVFIFGFNAFSQIGINTTNPQSQLDISASNSATPSNSDGILIPRISAFPITNPTVSQHGMMVFLTSTSAGKQPGFYYWDNTTTNWIGINSTINADTDWLKSSTGTTPNTTDDMYHMGNVGIGTNVHSQTLTLNGTGIYNTSTQIDNNDVNGIRNNINSSGSGWAYGEQTRLNGFGTGQQIGNYIKIASTNNFAEHNGIWVDMTNVNTTNNNRNGMRISMSGTATNGNHIGISTAIQTDNTSGTKAAMQNSISGIGQNYGIQNIFSSGNGTGIYNRFLGTVTGLGLFNAMEATTSNTQYGIYNNYNGASTGINYGVYNALSFGSGTEYGTYNDILNNTNGIKYGTYNRFLSTGTGAKYGTYNDFSGTIAFPLYGNYTNVNTVNSTQAIYGNYFNMNVTGNSSSLRTANYNLISGSGAGTVMGMLNSISYSGTGFKVGLENSFSGNSTGSTSGIRNTFSGQASDFYGLFNFFNTSGTTTQYGIMNASNGANSGTQYGVYNNFNNAASGLVSGIHNVIDRNSSSVIYGTNNDLRPNGTGNSYGTHTLFNGSGSGNWYANYTDIPNGGVGNKYGYFSLIRTGSGGQHYGIYSEALKTGAFAGYFLGNVSIGTTTTNNYILPASRGTNGQTMQIDGTGTVNWVDPSLRNYATTGASTGIYTVNSSEYTVRVYNGISEIRLPNAVGNQGKIFIIIGSNGISSKTFSTSGGFIYDDVTNSNISIINANERYSIQSDGTDWIVIGR